MPLFEIHISSRHFFARLGDISLDTLDKAKSQPPTYTDNNIMVTAGNNAKAQVDGIESVPGR